MARRAGLGLVAGAVLHGAAGAQARDTTRTRRDTTRAIPDSIRVRGDTLRRRGADSVGIPLPPDSARADSARLARERADSLRLADLARRAADTVKAPLARAEVPPAADIGAPYRWNREQLFASGAVTLGELLDRIPGVTSYASGWLATPHTTAYLGDFGRLRVYYDGVEIDPLDPTMGGMLDLGRVPIWTLEELVVERAAEELRVHLRSWRVDRTIPYTRVDVSTGDLETNSYRGFFGRRIRNGGALQIGAQQYSTQDPRAGGDGDLLALLGRLGWARGRFSVDGFFIRGRASRTEQNRLFDARAALPGQESARTDMYARVAYGDPAFGPWLQVIAASSRFAETNPKTELTTAPAPGTPFVGDTVDTTASRAQYVVAGGTRFGRASLSATARLRVYNGFWYLSPSGRAAFERGRLSVSAFAEQRLDDSTFRADVTARLTPLSFLAIAGSVGRTSAIGDADRPTSMAIRGEAGVRLGRLWVTGGMLSLDTAVVPAPVVYDTAFDRIAAGARTGTFVTLRGLIWKEVGLDVSAARWPEDEAYLPQYQVRSQLYLSSNWLRKFPNRNFHILFAVTHDYRTGAPFPSGDTAPLRSSQFRTVSTLLELRLYDATLSWQFRNVVGAIYEAVPGYEAPRAVNYYGVRWNFFN